MIVSHTIKNDENKIEGICFYDENSDTQLYLVADRLNNKIIINHDGKGKEFAKQILCQMIDEAEEIG